ncbi:hypothetical protein ACRALDRAFT_2027704 [Sodiomyces alcalophilus JCM 7366]|uniref:uncharacterized protein n=1 Tax=Sodiomyces alcalophilus JCM 7366 TaxID=591952 RepID=UPI0039B42FAC
MCLREIRVFQCPSRAGPVRVHTDKVNVLCAALEPCPGHLWERCEVYYNSMCPTCSGRISSVPPAAIQSFRINWTPRDNKEALDNEWVKRYVGDWASFMNLVLHSLIVLNSNDESVVTWETLHRLRESLSQEQACKEHGHRAPHCLCDANKSEIKQFLYNAASAVRNRAALQIINRIRWALWRLDEAVDTPARRLDMVYHRVASQRREAALLADRRRHFRYFREGRGRHRPVGAGQLASRRTAMQELWADALQRVNGVQAPPPGDAVGYVVWELINRRLTVLTVMGNMMMEDVGVSDERLKLAYEHMLAILPARGNRGASNIPELERLSTRVTQNFRGARLLNQIRWVRDVAHTWLTETKEAWNRREATYQAYEAFFNLYTEPLTGQQLEDSIANGTHGTGEACPVCYGHYFDGAPDQSQVQASPNMRPLRARADSDTSVDDSIHHHEPARPEAETRPLWEFYESDDKYEGGEIPVRVSACGHVFGARCLFRLWVGSSEGRIWTCPLCRTTAS